ncbi:MAG: BLUF domain-containing protein [Pseudomonadota bacterium]
MRLCHLVYSSRRASQSADDLKDIFETAHSNNAKRGVTGALFVQEKHFFQVLEGPQDELLSLFARLMDDPRHTCVTMTLFEELNYRMFDQWAMAEFNDDNPDIAKIFDTYSMDFAAQSIPSGVAMWQMLNDMARAVLKPTYATDWA